MLTQVKLYAAIIGVLAVLGGGWYIRGVFAERDKLRLQNAELNDGISLRDNVIAQLKKTTAENNKIIENMGKEAKALTDSRDAAQARVDQLSRDYQALSVQHQAPLPNGCEEAVRETARRAGAKP